jgi:hypothetical protein
MTIEIGLSARNAESQLVDREAAFATAQSVLDELGRREPDSSAWHFLKGKLAELNYDPGTATREMAAAAAAAANDENLARLLPAIYHAAYDASQAAQTEEVRTLGKDSLRRAYEAAPRNLFLGAIWLGIQAKQKDPQISVTLDGMQPDIESMAAEVKQYNAAYDVVALLSQLRASIENDDWAAAWAQSNGLKNLMQISAAYQSDRDYQMGIHVLDFVVDEFSRSFRDSAPPTEQPEAGVPVAFSPFPQQVPSGGDAVLDARLSDLDLDGRLDVCVLRGGTIEIWRAADQSGWELLASAEAPAGYSHLLLYDLDDDAQNSPHAPKLSLPADSAAGRGQTGTDATAAGSRGNNCNAADPDVILYGDAGVRILENVWDQQTGHRTLSLPVLPEPSPGDEPLVGPMWPEVSGVTLVETADLNLDGDLDLLLITNSGARLWSNRNSFLFQDVTSRIQFPAGSESVIAAIPVDWDRDVDLDVMLAMKDGTVGILECLRHLTFRWQPLDGAGVSNAAAAAVAEVDGNVSWDLLVGGPGGGRAVYTRTPVTGRVIVDRSADVLNLPVDALSYWDYDNDGSLDLLAWNRDRIAVARGMSRGGFQQQEDLLAGITIPSPLLRCETGDLDGDGDVDLLLAGESGLRLCSNDGGNANGWLNVTLAAMFSLQKTGTQTRRTNHFGIGSGLELKAGPHYQAQVVRGQTTHFGLGKLERADVARITWTNGFPQNIMQPQQRQNVCEVETPKGSCPFLYTWNGERFVFATDLCWAAPLGMQTAQGGLMPGRSWEYLLVPGELLAPRDGRYVLQCTGELWEAEYFDQVELMAVDHPDEFEVYSNEKVGPPEITEFRIHTARTRNYPRAARTESGRDLLAGLSRRDGVFARPFDAKRMQGYTGDSLLELDLGPLADPANVRLFLTGWMFPTDTSMNVALAENPVLPGPQAPSLWVPDKTGDWQQVIPYMGFPGGKTKTIVVDLSGKFLSGDHRVRIATSMEIYWDEIFFTSGEQPGEYTLTPLTAVAADLHYRGFSRRIPQPNHAPPVFDYEQVRSEPAWMPMCGCFTRYGDVTELLTTADDRMAILFGGDEMTVEFAVPPAELPPGWKRDFILHNVGWDKDADLNTVLGQTVEPLPFAAMSSYPYPATENYPDTPLHREYLQKYQTRKIDDAPFRRLIHAWQPGTELISP